MATTFQDKVVWVTGASSGIGEAIAKEFAAKGAKLVLSARKVEELERVKQELNLGDDKVLVLPLDLIEHDKMEEKAQAVISKFGRIDYLINNGGVSQRSLAIDTKLEVDKKLIDINLLGTIAITKAVLPYMVKQKSGHIGVITSLTGKFGTPMRSAYAASKHGLHGFFDSLRAEHFKDNIQVTLICPGFIRTKVSINALTGDGSSQGTMDNATGKGISAEECARRIVKGISKEKEEILVGNKEVYAVLVKRFFPKLFSRLIKKAKVT